MRQALFIIMMMYGTLCHAQNEIGSMLGSAYPIGKPSDVDMLSSFAGGLYYTREFRLSEDVGFMTGATIYSTTYIMDGYFVRDSGNTDFRVTPDNYKQSSLTLVGAKVPLLFNFTMLKNEDGSRAQLRTGVYLDYLAYSEHQYKTGTINNQAPLAIDNRFQSGLNEEMSLSTAFGQKKMQLVLACGMYYQLTQYLDDNSSFRPLQFYFKLGFGWGSRKNNDKKE